MEAVCSPLRQKILVSAMDILHIGLCIQQMKLSGREAENIATLSEVLREIGYGVLDRATLIDTFVAKEDVDKSESKRAMGKAKQQSLERLGPLFKKMNHRTGDVSSPMQSDKVKQLIAKHKEELMKMEKKIEDLNTAHIAELERVRAEAAQEHLQEIKALSDQLKESRAVAEAAVARAPVKQVVPRQRKTSRATAMDNREEGNVTVDTKSFVTLLDVIGKSSENKLIAGINVPIHRLIQDIFDAAFKSPKDLHRYLQHLATNFISVLTLLPTFNKAFAAFVRAEATRQVTELEMESSVKMSSGIGTILSYCENDKFDMEKDEEKSKDIPDIVYDIKRALFCAIHGVGNSDDEIKRFVCRSRHNDVGTSATPVTEEDLRSFINSEVSNTCVKEHISIGNQTRCLMMHVLNCLLVVELLSKISIHATFQYLPKAYDLNARAKSFAQRAKPEVPFHESMTALEFLLTYVSPALENEDLMKDAWTVACSIFASLNQIVSVGNNASDEAKKNDLRKKQITSILREVECRTITGGIDETTDVFCSGTGQVHSERRLRAYRTFAVFFFRTPIERSLPPNFFAKFGFTRSFLRVPASKIHKLTTFITPNFCSEPGKYRDKFDSIVKKKVQKGEDMGERTLFIQGKEQRDSLKFLLDAHRALDLNGKKSDAGANKEDM